MISTINSEMSGKDKDHRMADPQWARHQRELTALGNMGLVTTASHGDGSVFDPPAVRDVPTSTDARRETRPVA